MARSAQRQDFDTQGAKNDALIQTADAYFLVHQYRGIYTSALYTVGLAGRLVEQIAGLRRDLVPAYEVDRPVTWSPTSSNRRSRRGNSGASRARELTRVLRLDPRAVVEPLEHDHTQVTLLDPGRDLDDLIRWR